MHRTFSVLVMVLLVMLSVTTVTTAQEADPSGEQPARVLHVVDTIPLSGQELEPGDSIEIFFDRALDCATIAGAFSIVPTVAGDAACGPGDTSLRFTPTQDYAPATAYRVTLDIALRAADGAQLLEAYTLDVSGLGALRVVDVLPSDGASAIAVDSLLTVVFNRPVVPLVIAEDVGDLPDPLVINPPVAGRGEWLNTAIYTFRPDVAWSGATRYTVQIAAGLEAADGAVLAEGFTWSFVTDLPRIRELNPRDASTGIELDRLIQVVFNQPVDRASLEEHFYLRPEGTAQGRVSGTFEWSDDGTGFGFRADDLLALDTVYEAGFPANSVRDVTGQAALPAANWSFATVPAPSIINTSPFDGQQDAPLYGGFTLYFASPMDRATFENKFTIEPEPWREPDLYYEEYNNAINVSFPPEPSTTYTITVAPGMADIYGNVITEPFRFTYTTEAYASDVGLRVPGPVGFYNAARAQTQVFLTHMNVSRIDLELYAVSLERFAERANNRESYYDPTWEFRLQQEELVAQWQIDSVAPENALRYELLDLGGAVLDCPGALPPVVRVGDTAIVITEPDPLRARSEPLTGDQLDTLNRGYTMPIVGGPVCAGGIRWWQVTLTDGRLAWVAESAEDEYYIERRIEGQTTGVTIPADVSGDGALRPGVYLLRASSPETRQFNNFVQTHFMIVATANLTMKSTLDGVLIWATDLQTGEALADMPITIYGETFTSVATGRTDSTGLLQLDLPRVSDLYVPRMAVLDSGEHFGLALSSWTEGVDPWRFGYFDTFFPQQYRLYLYTDRPIYRPGQPVYFRGVLRARDDVEYTPPPLTEVPVRIYDDRGEVIYDRSVALTEFGTFSDQFDLAGDSVLGNYRIEVNLTRDPNQPYEGGGVSFAVAEYRLPEFQVNVTPEATAVVQDDTIRVTVDSRYYFGGAVSGAQVDYNVVANDYFFQYTGRGGYYDFTDFDYDGGPGTFFGSSNRAIASGSGVTDAQGRLTIEVPAELRDTTRSQTFTIEAVVTEESQQAVAGRAIVTVHQGLIYLGARPVDYVGTVGREASFEFIAVDWDSAPVAGQDINVEIVERRWSNVQEEDPNGRTVWTWQVEQIPVASGRVVTDEDGHATFAFTPEYGGVFKAIITTRDEAGNQVQSSTTMWVSSRDYVSWRQQNSNRIDLISDQQEYAIGDVAQVLIASPFQGSAEALITVERGDVLHVERVTLDSNSYVYELPIVADFAPNVYVSVLLVKGVDENNPVAAFRMGMIQLEVDTSQKVITIDITPDTDVAGPGDTVTYTVRTTDYRGEPVQAEVGVGLTDLASLSISEANSPDILEYYYGLQGVGVRTSLGLTINTDQITQTVLDTIKGGGGGFGEGGIFDIREEFVDTAYWNAALVTGADGIATFEVMLPDNLTTWRLDARAVTRGDNGLTLVGQEQFDLLSTRPLLIRPVTPRFFVVGDEVVLAAVVNNNTGTAQNVEVTLAGDGILFAGETIQTVLIPADGRARVEWRVTVQDVESVDLTFFASTSDGDYADASRPPLGQGDERLLPVYRYEAPETVGTGGVLRAGGSRTETILLPRRFAVTQGELTVSMEPSLAATMFYSMDSLRRYPYENIETTISRFLPDIMILRALSAFNVDIRNLRSRIDANVSIAVQRLYAQQKVDGGWGWYIQDRSNPMITAYALIALAEARREGFTVDSGTIERAQNFLQTQFITPGLNQPQWRLDRQVFILYALARSGAPDIARTTTMFDFRDTLSLYSKALLAQTLRIINVEDTTRTETLLSDLVNSAILSANGAHWEESARDYWNWNTTTRTTSLVMQALIMLRPESELIPNAVRWLMVARTADAWETPQETAWAVMALTDYMVSTGELNANYDFSVALNGETLAEGQARQATITESQRLVVQVADLLSDQANSLTFERTEGPGALYYSAYLRAYLPVPEVEALNRGIIIERRYTLLDDPDRTPITEARVGQLVQVRLTIIAPNDLHYVIIDDPIPAGSDAVNPNLETSQQIGTQPGLDASNPLSRGWGWWWFSNIEFRDERVVLSSTYLPAGTYEYVYVIRPGLEGVYNVIPATGREMYFPEVYGRAAGSTFTILPGE